MSVEVSSDQAYAFAEILEILSFTHISLVEKVPNKLISIFRNNALSTYKYHLNQDIPLEDQELSPETATLLTLISLNYWCTPEEKKELQQILIENEKTQKAKIEEKYSINNLFNNQNTQTQEINSSKENLSSLFKFPYPISSTNAVDGIIEYVSLVLSIIIIYFTFSLSTDVIFPTEP